MEALPTLMRLSKRVLLYLICIMFIACAFYTYYSGVVSKITVFNTIEPSEYIQVAPKTVFSVGYEKKANVFTSQRGFTKTTDSTSVKYAASKTPESHETTNRAVRPTNNNASMHLPNQGKSKFTVATRYVYLNKASSVSTPLPSTIRTTPPSSNCHVSEKKYSKLILLWTSFFGHWQYLPKGPFTHCRQCSNCRVTTDRERLPESDAVIFHARDMSVADLPPVRLPHQRWIFYCLESPPYSDFPGLSFMHNMFNWTMTYRADSDIVTQYGSVQKIYPTRKLDIASLKATWSNKTKSVSWMSSHCPTDGGRDEFVAELRKYIDVDVYGTCGTTICPQEGTPRCMEEFASKYKFFLAFENTICKDYVTEKFFRTLKYDIIPVVFGSASAYKRFAPAGSYIDALSFKSPKHLAFFLSGVGRDFKLYSSYFRWRTEYAVSARSNNDCALCNLLHKKDLKSSSYSDLRKWWVTDSHCRTWRPKAGKVF